MRHRVECDASVHFRRRIPTFISDRSMRKLMQGENDRDREEAGDEINQAFEQFLHTKIILYLQEKSKAILQKR